MHSDIERIDLVDTSHLEKVVLSQKIGKFLRADQDTKERLVIEGIAQMLAQDIHRDVRMMLAFELRNCDLLSTNLAETIIKDIAVVAKPFLEETQFFNDEELAHLIPELKNHAHITLARRKDIGDQTITALVTSASDEAVTFVVRNDDIIIPDPAYNKMIIRFGRNQHLMDYLSQRVDLPMPIIGALIERTSAAYCSAMVDHYGIDDTVAADINQKVYTQTMWTKVNGAPENRIHGYVLDLKRDKKLSLDIIFAMAERGSYAFLISALAALSCKTRGEIKEICTLEKKGKFVDLMSDCNIENSQAPKVLKLVKSMNAKND